METLLVKENDTCFDCLDSMGIYNLSQSYAVYLKIHAFIAM